jgi:hypothetical protein
MGINMSTQYAAAQPNWFALFATKEGGKEPFYACPVIAWALPEKRDVGPLEPVSVTGLVITSDTGTASFAIDDPWFLCYAGPGMQPNPEDLQHRIEDVRKTAPQLEAKLDEAMMREYDRLMKQK